MSTWEERMAAKHAHTQADLDAVRIQNGIDFPYEKAVQDSLDYCSKCAEPRLNEWANRWESTVVCGLWRGGCECEHHKDEIWLA
jgi:hypothetical protein